MKIGKFLYILFLGSMITLIASTGQKHLTNHSLVKQAELVRAIKINDSMTKEQASSIIGLYWSYIVKSNCLPTKIEDGGEFWFCIPNTGEDCEPDKNRIQVNKANGSISWGGGSMLSITQSICCRSAS